MTYLLLNTLFLVLAAGLALRFRARFKGKVRQVLQVMSLLLLLTLVFDNIIILLHIVSYHTDQISGLYLYRAPIEDFAYTIGAVLIVAALWEVES